MKINFRAILAPFRNNWMMKLSSLFIAIIIWFVVVQYVNPEDTRKIEDIHIEINTLDSIPVSEGLILVTDYNENVDITYTAARDVIAMLDVQKIRAYVDISSATKSGEYKCPVRIDTGGQNITVVDQNIKEVVLKFEKRATASVEINAIAEGIVPEGYIKEQPICTPEKLSIEGPESKVALIKSVVAVVPEKTFKETKSYSCEYRFLDAHGNTVSKDYITADVERIDVKVTVRKTKSIPITASIINSSGGDATAFATYVIEPSSILVTGSDEVLETYNVYDLGPIDVSEKSEDFTQSYVVTLQNGVNNVNNITKINVTVKFADVVTKEFEFKHAELDNKPDDLKASITNKSFKIKFRGLAEDMENIKPEDIQVKVDMKNNTFGVGQHNIPVHVIIPNDYKIAVLGKYSIMVEVK